MSGAGKHVVTARVKSEKKMKLLVLRRVAVAVVAALVATVVQVAPIQAQAQGDVEGLVSPDLAFAELDESVEVDVIANDDGVELFEADPVLTVTGQPNAATFTVVLDAEDGTPMLLLTPDAGWGGIARGTYRACWGDQCGSAQVEVYVGTSECTIVGTSGRDTLRGTPGNDVICALGGADVINARGGNDIVFGGRGADEINGGAGADSLYGGRGADLINGGGGNDFLYGRRGNDTLDGGNGADELHGNRGRDLLLGGNGADELYGGRNDDELRGQDGRDVLKGRKGADLLIGGANDDELYGNRGADRLRGQAGDDVLDGGRGTDELLGGSGTDTCSRGETYNGCEEIVEPPDEEDADGDGVPDAEDPDDDNDGIPDELDEFPLDPGESSDTDGDGIGDNSDPDADNDGVLNEDDDFPFDDSETVDSDGGGLGDNADPDDDDDGVFDDVDVFPNDGTEWEDTDGDGIGDNADTDDDNDGVPDVDDAFPQDPTETKDSDFDGIGDNADDDDDNDGVPDANDAFPTDSLVSLDTDGDGIGDLLDDDNDGDGVNDFADAFPNDPTEQFDTDLDGVGNNADTDDDDDTFLDDVDAFPLDPDEWEDLNGNGVGDNQDAVNDLDGDGIPDVDDPDIDGDLVDNGDDAFPRDPTEWSDLDGDGIGDNTDSDDDGDGVEDEEDLLPNDPNAGVDSDLDGTPDAFDAAPNDATDPRFMVEADEPSGAATEIISDSLILPEEVVITEIAVEQDDPIETVAASEIVDFEIEGPVTEFTTARITIPIDPVLAQQPDPVEVWWLNEEYGLWVPDGTDLQVDAANATVSVTVDHFSSFIALRKGANPFIVPPDTLPQVCIDTGVDVFLLVDDSGSNEFDYLIGGTEVPPSDPETIISEPGQPPFTVTPERVEAARDLTLGLNEDTDRVAVAGFAEGIESTDLEYIGNSTNGYVPVITAVTQLVAEPASGTDLLGALQSASGFLLGAQGSDRAKVIVVLTDGGTDTYEAADVVAVVDESVVVHVVGIGDSPNEALETVAQARGGVYAPSRTSPLFGSMLQRIDELNVDIGEVDFDNDTLTDCEEIRGMPTTMALGWSTGAGSEVLYNPAFWPTSLPGNPDSDGDLLWDSEELRRIDLRADPVLESVYSLVIDAGVSAVFLTDGADPLDDEKPVDAAGSPNRAYRFVDSLPALVAPKAARLSSVRQEALDLVAAASGTDPNDQRALLDLVAEIAVLEDDLAPDPEAFTNAALVSSRVAEAWSQATSNGGVADWTPLPPPEFADAVVNRVLPLFSGSGAAVFDRDEGLTEAELLLIAQIEAASLTLTQVDANENPAAWAAVFQAREANVLALLDRIPTQGESARQLLVKFEDLAATSSQVVFDRPPGPNGEVRDRVLPFRLGARGAYRILKLRSMDELADRSAYFVGVLAWDTAAGGPAAVRDAAFFGVGPLEYERFVLEARATFRMRSAEFESQNEPTYELFTQEQNDAINLLFERFEQESQSARPAVLTQPPENDTLGKLNGLPRFGVPSVTWLEFESVASASADVDAGVLERIWDDIALAHANGAASELGSAWQSEFGPDGPINEPEFNAMKQLSWPEFARQFDFIGLFDDGADGFSTETSDAVAEQHAGMVTEADLIAFSLFRVGYSYFGANADLIDKIRRGGQDGVISRADLDRFIDEAEDRGESPDVIETMRAVVAAGFFDTPFDLVDLQELLEALQITLAVVAGGLILFGAPAGLIGLVTVAAFATDLASISISIENGDVGSAVFDGVFIIFDGVTLTREAAARVARRFVSATEPARRVLDAAPSAVDSASAIRFADENVAPDEIAQDFASAIDLRSSNVTIDRGVELYLTQRATRTSRAAALQGDGLASEDVIPLIARLEGDEALLGRLTVAERQAYDEIRVAGYSDDQLIAVGRWDDPGLSQVAAACRVRRSFSGDTLVEMADNTLVPIADVRVGDQVVAYDFVSGEPVARAVTATLPHTDWLLEAHFSDGSVMSVTEDHRFWSVTDDEWVELQELDPTDRLLTPDGATVTVDWLDWDAGVTAPAWDLTVAEEHNFFVAADRSAEPLLVHNATRKATCDLPFGPDQADILRAVGELPPDLRDGLEAIVGDLTESGLPDADVIRFTDFASSNPERVRPQLEAWPEYVPLASASGLPDGPLSGGATVIDGVVVADADALASAASPPVASRADGSPGLETKYRDGQSEIRMINSPNVNDNGYLRTGPRGRIRVLDDGRLFGFLNGSPDFPARFEMILNRDTLLGQISSPLSEFDSFRTAHFQEANGALADVLEANPELRDALGVTESIADLRAASGPPGGFTWHHHQDFGRMQLVPSAVHGPVNHTGGIALWPRLAAYLGLS